MRREKVPYLDRLLFATNNVHKIEEVQLILGELCRVESLKDRGIKVDLPETGITLVENAIQKANYIHDNYGLDCMAEDAGLELDYLHGAPGVHTARYAGPDADAGSNMAKLLSELGDSSNRAAKFRTVIALWLEGVLYTFEGEVEGRIAYKQEGTGGFGYDPIFIPDGYSHTFAELPGHIKHAISHRARAVQKLAEFIQLRKEEIN